MPSFDVVSKVDMQEVDNAVNSAKREMEQRYDFKGSKSSLERNDTELTILADDDMKLRQIHELLATHFTRRSIDTQALDYKAVEQASGNMVRQKVSIKQGIDKEIAKKLTKAVKDSKLKVQAAIQGEELRITGKKRDDLQEAIAMFKAGNFGLPLQYINFRD